MSWATEKSCQFSYIFNDSFYEQNVFSIDKEFWLADFPVVNSMAIAESQVRTKIQRNPQ